MEEKTPLQTVLIAYEAQIKTYLIMMFVSVESNNFEAFGLIFAEVICFILERVEDEQRREDQRSN